MINSQHIDLSEIELPEKYSEYYNFRIKSFLERFQIEYELSSFEPIIRSNLELWNYIIKNEVIDHDLESTLRISGYDLFTTIETDEFSKKINNDPILFKAIAEWKILIWYIEFFTKAVLVSKSYSVSDSVSELLN